jgi:hypothetical protein
MDIHDNAPMTTDRRRPGIFSGRPRDRFTVTVTYQARRGTCTEDYGFTARPQANVWFDQIAHDLGVLQIVMIGPDGALVAEYRKGSV